MSRKMSAQKIAICDWIVNNAVTDKNEIIKRCKAIMDKPDIGKLKRQYWNRVTNSVVASVRDSDNVRQAFPVAVDGNVLIHVIAKSTDIKALQVIDNRLDRQIGGAAKSRAAVRMRMAELAGQMVFKFQEAEQT